MTRRFIRKNISHPLLLLLAILQLSSASGVAARGELSAFREELRPVMKTALDFIFSETNRTAAIIWAIGIIIFSLVGALLLGRWLGEKEGNLGRTNRFMVEWLVTMAVCVGGIHLRPAPSGHTHLFGDLRGHAHIFDLSGQ